MNIVGFFVGCSRDVQGNLIASFIIPEEFKEEISEFQKVRMEIKKYFEKRSLDANRYFWKLCGLIAEKIGSDKDTVYKLQLAKYGQFVDADVEESQVDSLKALFRHTEEYADPYIAGTGYTKVMHCIRCYIGSSNYDRKEMSYLINGTVQDAHDLGISTWSDEELFKLLERWKPHERYQENQ